MGVEAEEVEVPRVRTLVNLGNKGRCHLNFEKAGKWYLHMLSEKNHKSNIRQREIQNSYYCYRDLERIRSDELLA